MFLSWSVYDANMQVFGAPTVCRPLVSASSQVKMFVPDLRFLQISLKTKLQIAEAADMKNRRARMSLLLFQALALCPLSLLTRGDRQGMFWFLTQNLGYEVNSGRGDLGR